MQAKMEAASRAEAERLLGISEKLLQSRDLNGSRDFAILAQETDPLLEGSDQILAVVEVLLSSEKRVNKHNDWYAILQVDCRSGDLDLIKKQYRKLALLLHPDKNKFAWADQAFRLVAEAWAVLSNPSLKSKFDNELSLFTKVDLNASNIPQHSKFPVRRSTTQEPPSFTPYSKGRDDINGRDNLKGRDNNQGKDTNDGGFAPRVSTFWTACPYCYRLYEYPNIYEDCCLRCQNCHRGFHATLVPSLPPLVPGKEAYYCGWGVFPLGFVMGNPEPGKVKESMASFSNMNPPVFPSVQQEGGNGFVSGGVAAESVTTGGKESTSAFPNWNPPVFPSVQQEGANGVGSVGFGAENVMKRTNEVNNFSNGGAEVTKRKRGRPRKNPVL